MIRKYLGLERSDFQSLADALLRLFANRQDFYAIQQLDDRYFQALKPLLAKVIETTRGSDNEKALV